MITLKGDMLMKITKKRILLAVLGIIVITILSFITYFYVALSGNPIVKWQKKQVILRIYEDRYEEDFKVIRSHYDYKRGDYFYTLEPVENPQLKFNTSVYESTQRDLYAELRAEDVIRQAVEDALNGLLDPQSSTMNIYEEHNTLGGTETDVHKRLRENHYVISISRDVDLLDPGAVDAATMDMGQRIDTALGAAVGGLTLRVSVYDGDNYHFSDVDIR